MSEPSPRSDFDEGKSNDSLFARVYDDLRRMAAARLENELPNQTLDATALVHEAYLRMAGSSDPRRWENRAHFFAAAAESMRRILVDVARRKRAAKRSSAQHRAPLDPDEIAAPVLQPQVLAVDEALTKLADTDPQAADLVKLRYFAGLTIPEAADVLGVSPRTADAWWAYARAWLLAELKPDP